MWAGQLPVSLNVPTQKSRGSSSAFRFSIYVRLNQLLNAGKCPKSFCLCRKASACCETPAPVLVLPEQRAQPRILKGTGCRMETRPGRKPQPCPGKQLCLPDSPGQGIKLRAGSTLPSPPAAPAAGCIAHESGVLPLGFSPRCLAQTGTSRNGSTGGEHSVAMGTCILQWFFRFSSFLGVYFKILYVSLQMFCHL